MAEVVRTLEGWYSLHDFRSIDWVSWKELSSAEREEITQELIQLFNSYQAVENNQLGSSVFYTVAGQKADFVFMHLRPTLQELIELETAFQKTRFADYTIPAYSYVSVVELSNYVNKPGEDPYNDPYVRRRLFPTLPRTEYLCFYPMDKRREGQDNWYMLPMEERRELMKSHGMIGRSYAEEVTQVITGSVGLDDWEWGVTLFSDDPLVFKKMIYEMRFDEVSARYGEFGSFFVGHRLDEAQIKAWLQL